jgi:hypothetical protein
VATGILKYAGTPAPGARISIEVEGSPDPDAVYRWDQIEGPHVDLGEQTGPKIQLTVPRDARSLGFLVSIRDSKGPRRAQVVIPVGPAAAARDGRSAAPRADAGDDQIGLVGHGITLNGSRSTPSGAVTYRWFPLGGPKVQGATQENGYYSFTPSSAGIYRFGLVVASASAGKASISDVDEVVVTVGEFSPNAAPGIGAPIPMAAIDQLLQGPTGASSRGTLDQVAGVFDAIAARTSLYSSFAELSSELTRRVDAAIPSDPNWRQFWAQSVFAPLTLHLANEMISSGIDLRTVQGQQQGLNAQQQERLRKLFTAYAREFHSRTQDR